MNKLSLQLYYTQTKFRNTQRNFTWKFFSPNEISFEIPRDVSHNQAKYRTCQDNSASKFLRNFEKLSFPSKYRWFSPIFVEIRSYYFCTVLYRQNLYEFFKGVGRSFQISVAIKEINCLPTLVRRFITSL